MSSLLEPERLHPSLWRASQLARSTTACVDTAFASLSAELPGRGWPTGVLIELCMQHAGTAEMRLLRPALRQIALNSARQIVLLQAPYTPQIQGLCQSDGDKSGHGLSAQQLLWIRCAKHADALWAAEQILRSGSCAALLCWSPQIRREALQRLHLAAAQQETLFVMVRPLSSAQSPSPAALRLGIKSVAGGVEIDFIKRRGSWRDAPLFLPLTSFGSSLTLSSSSLAPTSDKNRHEQIMDSAALTSAAAGNIPSELVG
jgi:protein ImuA